MRLQTVNLNRLMNLINVHARQIGVTFRSNVADVRVWAPAAVEVALITEARLRVAMQKTDMGYWSASTSDIYPGALYKFEVTNAQGEQLLLPDPASIAQPEGVHGYSCAVNIANLAEAPGTWQAPDKHQYIIYELHIGTFTPDGTFNSAIEKLDELCDLGITAVEVMPIASFPGSRNWGYDGVDLFAVQQSYGGPEGFMRFVEACHSRGLAVILDVVYNHLGPEGNYLPAYGPYFTDKYHTPWGQAVNVDDKGSDQVRAFFIENALMWLRDFKVDALRLDAVHAIKDLGARHFLSELHDYVQLLNEHTKRNHLLMIENDLNDPRYIDPREKGGYGMSAQWIDEFHHALRVSAGQATVGYYADFNGITDLAKSYGHAYVYDGQYSIERQRTFGAPATQQGSSFIVFSQNHDQIGNRPLGERSANLYSLEMLKLMAGAVLVSPFIPLLFMGEEWGETQPFQYFVSHSDDELIEAVRNGRKAEFEAFHIDGDCPDPQSPDTFLRSKLNWEGRNAVPNTLLLKFYTDMIALRKQNKVLSTPDRLTTRAQPLNDINCMLLYRLLNDDKIMCALNFSDQAQHIIMEPYCNFNILLDSASAAYGGAQASSFSENADHISLLLQPQSILIASYV